MTGETLVKLRLMQSCWSVGRFGVAAVGDLDFPEPAATFSAALVPAWPDVERWAKATGRPQPQKTAGHNALEEFHQKRQARQRWPRGGGPA
jgi:hypothetical protein